MAKGAYLDKKKLENIVTDIFIKNRNLRTKEVTEKAIPVYGRTVSESAVQQILTALHKKDEAGELKFPEDSPWTIGSCSKYNIPAEMIPNLLREQNYRLDNQWHRIEIANYFGLKGEEYTNCIESGLLSIRQALWFCKLFPAVIQIAKQQFPDDEKKQFTTVAILGRAYAHRELIAKITGKEYADTSDLDKTLMNGDFSDERMTDIVIDYCFPEETKQQHLKDLQNFPGYTIADYEPVLGKLTQAQVDLLNEWFKLVGTSEVQRKEFEKANPELLAITKGYTFSAIFLAVLDEKQKKDGE